MIHLFNKNKFGRNIVNPEEEKVIWRSFFKTSEDSLSASVIGLLCYLPANIIWRVLSGAANNLVCDTPPTKLLSFEFWPHWNCANTANTNFVEPDIFLEFDNCDVIIEAKRYDYREQQNRNQWQDEIIAYLNEYETRKKQVYFIALSGLTNMSAKQADLIAGDRPFAVATMGWERLLKSVQNAWHTEQMRQEQNAGSDDALGRVFEDIITAFALHGFFVGEMLNSLPANYNITTALDFQKKLLMLNN